MAKDQNISLNPSKIAGNCGRLMCCLKYEEDVYMEKLKRLPKVGAIVKTEDGTGEVISVETLEEKVKVKYTEGPETFYKKHNAKDIEVIKDVEIPDEMQLDNTEELKELEKLGMEDRKNNQTDEL
jgi:cell fate regulator YaaT (PSP1 superfamily)